MPFPFEPAAERSGLARFVGARGAALRSLEDLLARAERVRDVSVDQVHELAARHGVDLSKKLHTARCGLYRRFLEHCLLDQALSEEESEELTHLKRLLGLTDPDAAGIHEQVARSVFGCAIDQALEDHRLDPEEEEFLRRLGRDLELAEPEATHLLDEGAARARQRFMSRTLAHDSVFVAAQGRTLELRGTAQGSLEQAIGTALAEATRAVPDLQHFEVTKIRGELDRGHIARWEVTVRAALPITN
jgi:flavin-binding protein dodecin